MQGQKIGWINVLLSIFMLVIGVLILSNPATTINTLTMMVGIAVLVTGVVLLINYKATSFNLALGIVAVILGIFLLARPSFAVSAIAFLIGIWFIIEAVQGLIRSGFYRLLNRALFIFSVVTNVLELIAGILIVFHPFLAALSLPILAGVALIIGAVGELISAFSPKPQ
jgi:uncharacterized membrane protein HdeD (DUF308 family)